MRKIITLLSAALVLLSVCTAYCQSEANQSESRISIPVNGNSWYLNHSDLQVSANEKSALLTKDTLRTFFSIQQKCKVFIAVVIQSETNEATIDAVFDNNKKSIRVKPATTDTIEIGNFPISIAGYNHLDLINPSNTEGIHISNVIVRGDFDGAKANFVKDEYYWGKRGPSVHLTFSPEKNIDSVKWFYNEINVPKGNDVIGSYFMAIGFGEGYFGIQVNSETERRILFSVWSPFKTDNPKEIPENQQIRLLKKGDAVTAGKFGGEGSGGQSYLKYMWKAGVTYQFLLKGEPAANNYTDYTAYFFSPDENRWMLIASFSRPQTSTYLKRFHSFLENFIPAQGKFTRMGIYSNQWVCDKNGIWTEANKAKFTADNTARKGNRLDYAGGLIDGQFFMKNCGFFNETVTIGSEFTRPLTNKKPDIDFQGLP